eukprot:SAG11_NODE_4188_length_2022_cov_4.568903_1_plen_194_part_00
MMAPDRAESRPQPACYFPQLNAQLPRAQHRGRLARLLDQLRIATQTGEDRTTLIYESYCIAPLRPRPRWPRRAQTAQSKNLNFDHCFGPVFSYIDDLIATDVTPGAVIAVARHGKLLTSRAIGCSGPAVRASVNHGLAGGQVLCIDSIFAVASVTKPATAAAVRIEDVLPHASVTPVTWQALLATSDRMQPLV